MRWTVHGERVLYDCEWLRLTMTEVEVPNGPRFEHHVVRMPNMAAGAIVVDRNLGVLMLWRHRFITDTWGWEIPAGGIDPGESPEAAAHRETVEETGWRPGPMRALVQYHPTNGLSDQTFHCFIAEGAEQVGAPTDPGESERIEWVPVPAVRDAVRRNLVRDGLSLTALCYALAYGHLE